MAFSYRDGALCAEQAPLDDARLRDAMTIRARRRVRRDNTVSIDGVDWQTDLGFLATRAHDDHRHPASRRANGPQHVEPVDLGKHEVEQYEVGLPAMRFLDAGTAITRHLHGVLLPLEVVAEAVGEIGVVLDQQDARHHEVGWWEGGVVGWRVRGKVTTNAAPVPVPSST